MSSINKRALTAGTYAILFRDNWDGEGDVYETLATLSGDLVWYHYENGRALIEYEGDEVLKAWPLDDGGNVLALLDELEAKDKQIIDSESRVRQQNRNVCEMFDENTALRKSIAELEARTLTVPDGFAAIGENIRTQDNRITSDPMFCVFQKREIVVDEDYDCDRIMWVDEDGKEATERQRMRLELLHDNCREAPEKWRRIAVKDIDDFVTCCFTEQGCKDYLACNGHNLRLPFIYVKSGFRNDEYQAVRNWLAGIALDTGD